jgi:hypothetical protein
MGFHRPAITLSARSTGSFGSLFPGSAMVTSWWVWHERVCISQLKSMANPRFTPI